MGFLAALVLLAVGWLVVGPWTLAVLRAVTLAPDGSAYVATLGGMVRVRDG